jgi:8-oxo-dGTP diphosphatase
MKYSSATPYVASFVIIRKEGKIAFVLRENTKWMNGFFGLPSGKVEKNEAFTAAAIREAKEEIGITVKSTDLSHALTVHRYEAGSFADEWVDVYFEVSEWEGVPYNAEPSVHSELAWLDPGKLPDNIVPSVRFGLEQIKAGRSYGEYGWATS